MKEEHSETGEAYDFDSLLKNNGGQLYKRFVTFDRLIELFLELREAKVKFMMELKADEIEGMNKGDVGFNSENVLTNQPTFTTKAEYIMALLAAQADVFCAYLWHMYPFKFFNFLRKKAKRDTIIAALYSLFTIETNIFAEELVERETKKKIKRKTKIESMPVYGFIRKKYQFFMRLILYKYPSYEDIMSNNSSKIQEVKDQVTLQTVNSVVCKANEYVDKYKLKKISNFNWYYALALHAEHWQFDEDDRQIEDPSFYLLFPMFSNLDPDTLQEKLALLASFGVKHELLEHEFEFMNEYNSIDKSIIQDSQMLQFEYFQEKSEILVSVINKNIGLETISEKQIQTAVNNSLTELSNIDPDYNWATHPSLQGFITDRVNQIEVIRTIRENPDDYIFYLIVTLCDNLMVMQSNCIVTIDRNDPTGPLSESRLAKSEKSDLLNLLDEKDVLIINKNHVWWSNFKKYVKVDNSNRQKFLDDFLKEHDWRELYTRKLLTRDEEIQIVKQIGDHFGDFMHETADLLELDGDGLIVMLSDEILIDRELDQFANIMDEDRTMEILHQDSCKMGEKWRMKFGNQLLKYLTTSIDKTKYERTMMSKHAMFEYLKNLMS
ncbi:MAG: hypothetical protein HeimC2_38220 [Candidatus Heimdallarchaeota archaeon LC_2]|nr:MAG: hypothetical protein HeimC2_38220 [Candidatus Heimdallarchaeota archaeon LC_2]